jgi:hypothetical protein
VTGPDTSVPSADEYRETVLALLEDLDRSVTVGELAEAVASEHTGDHSPDVDVPDVHEALVEDVLPALQADERIDFDSDRGIVSLPSDRLVTRLVERVIG